MDIRKHFFTVKAADPWHRLPSKAVDSSSLQILSKPSGHHPGSWPKVSLSEQGAGPHDLQRSLPTPQFWHFLLNYWVTPASVKCLWLFVCLKGLTLPGLLGWEGCLGRGFHRLLKRPIISVAAWTTTLASLRKGKILGDHQHVFPLALPFQLPTEISCHRVTVQRADLSARPSYGWASLSDAGHEALHAKSMGESLHCQNSVWEVGNLPGFKDDADVIFFLHVERELCLSDLVTQCAKLKVVTRGHSLSCSQRARRAP